MKEPIKTHWTSGIRLPMEVAESLKEMAKATNRSVNSMIMECITHYFKNVYNK